jgi:hypothetical protein
VSRPQDSWRSPTTTDKDYWELQYLKTLKQSLFFTAAKACGGIAVLLVIAIVVVIKVTGPWPGVFVTILAALNVAAALGLGFIAFGVGMNLKYAIDFDNRAGKLERRQIAEQLRLFALKQEHDFGFLLSINGWHPDRPHDAREEWALDHAREIRERWPADFEEYRRLQASVDYNRARADVFDNLGRSYGEGTLRFEEILNSRQDMRDRVARSLRKDRATTAIERDGTIEETEKVREERMRTVAANLRKARPEDEDWQ